MFFHNKELRDIFSPPGSIQTLPLLSKVEPSTGGIRRTQLSAEDYLLIQFHIFMWHRVSTTMRKISSSQFQVFVFKCVYLKSIIGQQLHWWTEQKLQRTIICSYNTIILQWLRSWRSIWQLLQCTLKAWWHVSVNEKYINMTHAQDINYALHIPNALTNCPYLYSAPFHLRSFW